MAGGALEFYGEEAVKTRITLCLGVWIMGKWRSVIWSSEEYSQQDETDMGD
jgi:hypothetical protein